MKFSQTIRLVAVFFATLSMAQGAWADDWNITTSFTGVGPGAAQQFEFPAETAPIGTWGNVTVTNTGSQQWTGFHYEIYQLPSQPSVANIDFLTSFPWEPTSSQSPFTTVVNNVVVGATLDFSYPLDPVLPTQTATFNAYISNPDQVTFFGLLVYPTPEPGSAMLLSTGALLLLRRKSA